MGRIIFLAIFLILGTVLAYNFVIDDLLTYYRGIPTKAVVLMSFETGKANRTRTYLRLAYTDTKGREYKAQVNAILNSVDYARNDSIAIRYKDWNPEKIVVEDNFGIKKLFLTCCVLAIYGIGFWLYVSEQQIIFAKWQKWRIDVNPPHWLTTKNAVLLLCTGVFIITFYFLIDKFYTNYTSTAAKGIVTKLTDPVTEHHNNGVFIQKQAMFVTYQDAGAVEHTRLYPTPFVLGEFSLGDTVNVRYFNTEPDNFVVQSNKLYVPLLVIAAIASLVFAIGIYRWG